jgi:hypothetical protein
VHALWNGRAQNLNIDLRHCLREPIPQIFEAADLLEKAVEAYLANDRSGAEQLLRAADMPIVREWTESIWGAASPYVEVRSVYAAAERASSGDAAKLIPLI